PVGIHCVSSRQGTPWARPVFPLKQSRPRIFNPARGQMSNFDNQGNRSARIGAQEKSVMHRRKRYVPGAVVAVAWAQFAFAGVYSGPHDTSHPIDPAIPSNSPRFTEWANAIDPARTFFAPRGSTTISNTGFNSLGDLDASQIAGGASPGYLTVTFPSPI